MRSNWNSNQSPTRKNIDNELDQHTNRIKELLKGDMIYLQQQNQILRAKCRKATDLQHKVDMVLSNNELLQIQNDKLVVLVNEQGRQIDLLKAQLQTIKLDNSQLQIQRNKLLSEVNHLKDQIYAGDKLHSSNVRQIQLNHCSEVDKLAKKYEQAQKDLEEENRYLRNKLEEKDYDMASMKERNHEQDDQLRRKIQNLNDRDDEIKKLRERLDEKMDEIKNLKEKLNDKESQLKKAESHHSSQKQQLKKEIDALQRVKDDKNRQLEHQKANHKKEVEFIKTKLQKIQKQHGRSQEQWEDKLNKAEKDLHKAERQKQPLISEISKVKQAALNGEKQASSQIKKLKEQNQLLKRQIFKLQELNKQQFQQLQMLFDEKNKNDMMDLKIAHQQNIQSLQRQLYKLQSQLHQKQKQLQYNIDERQHLKQILIKKGNDLKEELQMLLTQHKNAQASLRSELHEKQLQIRSLLDAVDKFRAQNDNLKETVQNQQEQLNKNKQTFNKKEQTYRQSINDWKKSCIDLKTSVDRDHQSHRKEKEDLQSTLRQQISNISKENQQLKAKNVQLNKENEILRDTLLNRDKKIKDLEQRLEECYKIIDQREREIDSLRQMLIEVEKSKVKTIQEQRDTLDGKSSQKIRYLTDDFNTKIKMLENSLLAKEKQLKLTQDELTQLLRQYKKMKTQLTQISEQEANKKDMTLKYSGATADLIATKNLFDVFLKGKVIEYCGDAIDKENRQGQ